MKMSEKIKEAHKFALFVRGMGKSLTREGASYNNATMSSAGALLESEAKALIDKLNHIGR